MKLSTAERTREWIKTALIVLLLPLAAYLTYETWFFAVPADSRPFSRSTVLPVTYTEYTEYAYAAQAMAPVRAALRSAAMLADASDALYAASDREGARILYTRLSPAILAEALGSIRTTQETTRARWTEALNAEMVFFDFEGQVPLYALAAGAGVSAYSTPDADARFMVLTGGNDGFIRLLYSDGQTYYECETEAEVRRLRDLTAGYEANGAAIGANGAPAEYISFDGSLPPSALDMYAAAGADTADADRVIDALLRALSLNPYTIASYTESSGTRVYIEQQHTLRLSTNGRASFTLLQTDSVQNTTSSPEAVSSPPDAAARADMIGKAGRLAELSLAPWLGDAQLYLVRAYLQQDTGHFVVLFGCEVGGIPILREEGYFLRAEFAGGTLRTAELFLNGFHRAGTGTSLLPWRQALAAALTSDPDLRIFGLYYRTGGDLPLQAAWLRFADTRTQYTLGGR